MHDRACLLLDMGKVLLDFDLRRFGRRMTELTGIDEDILRKAFTDDGLPRRYESGMITDRDFHRIACSRLSCQVSWEDFLVAWNSIFDPIPILPEETIHRLAERSDLWVVSNTNNLHFDYILKTYSFLRHFRGYILSHEVGAMKPDPRIFEAALGRAGRPPQDIVFVDDQEANVSAARALGMDAFQFFDPDQFELEMRKRQLL